MAYEIHDSHGAPQCGCETIRFDEWWEVEDYLDLNPEVADRIAEMYAEIVEVDG